MSVESEKNYYYGKLPIPSESEDYFPKDKVITFDINSLSPRRRSLALRQIIIYKKKMKLFPLKRSLYLKKIKELILYEKNKRWKE